MSIDFLGVMISEAKKMYKKKVRAASILEWDDEQHQQHVIHHLDVFRKSKQFCDLVIQV